MTTPWQPGERQQPIQYAGPGPSPAPAPPQTGGNVVNQGQWSPTPNSGGPNNMGADPMQSGGAPPQPSSASTLGQPMNPWLERWTGGFTAPLSPYENQSLQGLSGFVGGGMGLGGAQQYLNNTVNGNYLDVANNPNFQQIQNSEDQLLQTQQNRALQELQSRAAAGGNALSGGLMQQEGDYLRNSNAGLQSLMGQLMANQYSQERGLQSNAAGQLGGLANTQLGGYGQLMNQGAVPRQNDTNELLGQYADFVRQGQGLQQASQYPDQQIFNMLHSGYPNSYQMQYQGGGADAISSILASLLGNGSGGGDLSGIMNLFGGGNSGQTGGTDSSSAGADGMVIGHDGPSSPSSYQDWNWYNNQLTKEENAHQAQQANAGKSSGLTTGIGVAALLMKLLGGLGKSGKNGGSPFKGGGSPGDGSGKQGQPNQGSPNFQGVPTEQTPYGSNNPNMYGPYLPPPTQDAYGSNDPNMYGPYMPDPSSGDANQPPLPDLSQDFGNIDNSGGGADPFAGIDLSSFDTGGDSGGGFDGQLLGYDAQPNYAGYGNFGGIDRGLQNGRSYFDMLRNAGYGGQIGMQGYSPTIDIGGGQMLNTDHPSAFYNYLQKQPGVNQTGAGWAARAARNQADFNRSLAGYGLAPSSTYQDLVGAIHGGARYNPNNVHEAGFGDSAYQNYLQARANRPTGNAVQAGQNALASGLAAFHNSAAGGGGGAPAPPVATPQVRPVIDNTGRTTQTTQR